MVKAVIFDFDGVIVDSKEVYYQAYKKIMSGFDVNLSSEEFGNIFGMGAGNTFKHLFNKYGIKADVDKYVDEKDILAIKNINKVKIFDGSLVLIKRLADKYRLMLASNANNTIIKIMMKRLNLNKYFECYLGYLDVVKAKPNPEIYIKAADKLGLIPSECVVIEDSVFGVEAAKKAGMRCIAITNTTTRDKLSGADLVVDAYGEIEIE